MERDALRRVVTRLLETAPAIQASEEDEQASRCPVRLSFQRQIEKCPRIRRVIGVSIPPTRASVAN